VHTGFEELLSMAEDGDHRNVDMLVSDIYGANGYENLRLSGEVIASSFGRTVRSEHKHDYGGGG
jgi:type II pantothenate kinase